MSPFVTRDEILKLLWDDEAGNLAIEDEGGWLSRGEEYVDLVHLPQGVHRALTNNAANMKDFIRRRSLSDQTWSKLCSLLVGETVQ